MNRKAIWSQQSSRFLECLPKRLLERQVLSIPDEPMADHGREIGRHVVIIGARVDEPGRRDYLAMSWNTRPRFCG